MPWSTYSIRFYAELNDHLAPHRQYQTLEKEFFVPASVKDVIESFGVPHTEVELVLVNGESSGFSRPVRDGDRVAVYPVFESLDITPELRVRPQARANRSSCWMFIWDGWRPICACSDSTPSTGIAPAMRNWRGSPPNKSASC